VGIFYKRGYGDGHNSTLPKGYAVPHTDPFAFNPL